MDRPVTEESGPLDLVHLLVSVEAEIVAVSAERRTDEDLRGIWAAHAEIEALLGESPRSCDVIPRYRILSRRFHLAVYAGAHSDVYRDVGEQLLIDVERAFRKGSGANRRIEDSPELAFAAMKSQHVEHFAIATAVAKRRPLVAHAAAREHGASLVDLLAAVRRLA